MIYLVAFYWLVCGFALYMQPSRSMGFFGEMSVFIVCILIGGVALPAKLLAGRIW